MSIVWYLGRGNDRLRIKASIAELSRYGYFSGRHLCCSGHLGVEMRGMDDDVGEGQRCG